MTEPLAPLFVAIPLLNPNEPEGLLAALYVNEGQQVQRGQPLFTLETTKSTAEVEAERDGYVVGLRLEQGQQVRAGDLFCYLAASPNAALPAPAQTLPEAAIPTGQPVPAGLRITRPALELARRRGLDLSSLPLETLITEAMIHALSPGPAPISPMQEQGEGLQTFDPTALVIYGGGGHGKSVIDLVRLLGVYRIVGVIDDSLPANSSILGLPVLGGAPSLDGLYAQGVRLAINAVGGISNLQTRLLVFEKLSRAGFYCPAIVHPSAVVEASADLAGGVQVFAHAYIGSEARVGYGAIVNTGAILSHDCVLGEYANVSPGAILAGEVTIGAGALIGMGVTINLQVTVGAHARVGNGATVKANVPENGVVRAGSIWPA